MNTTWHASLAFVVLGLLSCPICDGIWHRSFEGEEPGDRYLATTEDALIVWSVNESGECTAIPNYKAEWDGTAVDLGSVRWEVERASPDSVDIVFPPGDTLRYGKTEILPEPCLPGDKNGRQEI